MAKNLKSNEASDASEEISSSTREQHDDNNPQRVQLSPNLAREEINLPHNRMDNPNVPTTSYHMPTLESNEACESTSSGSSLRPLSSDNSETSIPVQPSPERPFVCLDKMLGRPKKSMLPFRNWYSSPQPLCKPNIAPPATQSLHPQLNPSTNVIAEPFNFKIPTEINYEYKKSVNVTRSPWAQINMPANKPISSNSSQIDLNKPMFHISYDAQRGVFNCVPSPSMQNVNPFVQYPISPPPPKMASGKRKSYYHMRGSASKPRNAPKSRNRPSIEHDWYLNRTAESNKLNYQGPSTSRDSYRFSPYSMPGPSTSARSAMLPYIDHMHIQRMNEIVHTATINESRNRNLVAREEFFRLATSNEHQQLMERESERSAALIQAPNWIDLSFNSGPNKESDSQSNNDK